MQNASHPLFQTVGNIRRKLLTPGLIQCFAVALLVAVIGLLAVSSSRAEFDRASDGTPESLVLLDPNGSETGIDGLTERTKEATTVSDANAEPTIDPTEANDPKQNVGGEDAVENVDNQGTPVPIDRGDEDGGDGGAAQPTPEPPEEDKLSKGTFTFPDKNNPLKGTFKGGPLDGCTLDKKVTVKYIGDLLVEGKVTMNVTGTLTLICPDPPPAKTTSTIDIKIDISYDVSEKSPAFGSVINAKFTVLKGTGKGVRFAGSNGGDVKINTKVVKNADGGKEVQIDISHWPPTPPKK